MECLLLLKVTYFKPEKQKKGIKGPIVRRLYVNYNFPMISAFVELEQTIW